VKTGANILISQPGMPASFTRLGWSLRTKKSPSSTAEIQVTGGLKAQRSVEAVDDRLAEKPAGLVESLMIQASPGAFWLSSWKWKGAFPMGKESMADVSPLSLKASCRP